MGWHTRVGKVVCIVTPEPLLRRSDLSLFWKLQLLTILDVLYVYVDPQKTHKKYLVVFIFCKNWFELTY